MLQTLTDISDDDLMSIAQKTSYRFDNLINLTVQGNIDKDALPPLKDILKQSADYTINKFQDPLKRQGINTTGRKISI